MLADAGEDLAQCHRLLCDGSRSFLAASRLLPDDVARAACALYAFCRVADDRVDLDSSQGALEDLHERLERIYAGTPRPVAADRAFAAVVAHYRVPRAWPLALLEGFAWDAQGRQYQDLGQLRAYGARVAGSVGAMMACVMGVRGAPALARACELGVAMQLTNIARDVGDDARLGRLYLPRAWMHEAGIDPDAWLVQPVFSAALGGVVNRLLDEADHLYRGAREGIGSLPPSCRSGIRAAALLYAEIGEAVRRRGCDSVNARAIVGAGRKLQLVVRARLGGLSVRTHLGAPPPEIGFLVEAAPAQILAPPRTTGPVDTVLEIFEKLERRDRGSAPVFGAPRLT